MSKKIIENYKQLLQSDKSMFEITLYQLAGDNNKKLRQSIIKELTGDDVPLNLCSISRIKHFLLNEQTALF